MRQFASESPPDFDLATRLRYAGIDEATGRRLRGFWRIAKFSLPGILRDFYRHVGTEPELSAMISGRIEHLKKVQTSH